MIEGKAVIKNSVSCVGLELFENTEASGEKRFKEGAIVIVVVVEFVLEEFADHGIGAIHKFDDEFGSE